MDETADHLEEPIVQRITLPFLPDYVLHVGLFTELRNASFLRQQLLSGNADFEIAFIDASTILSTRHILAACFRAINDSTNNRLRSRNVHSEIVYSLNANSNIVDSFRHFGISDNTTSLVAIKVGSSVDLPGQSIAEHLRTSIEGTLQPFTDDTIAPLTDIGKIRKLYKLTSADSGAKSSKKKSSKVNGTKVAEASVEVSSASKFDDRREMEAIVLGIMAMKGS